MNKKLLSVRSLVDQFDLNCARIGEIADACEKEKRGRTADEEAEYKVLVQKNDILRMRMEEAASSNRANPNAVADVESIIRENVKNGRKTECMLMRSMVMVSDVNSGGLIPLDVQDILKPLQEGFILDKVGLPMPTGLTGEFVWPLYEMIEATVLAEGAALSDTTIPFSKLTASPARIGVAVPVTNQALNQSDGVLNTILHEVLPDAVKQILNKILFSTEAVNAAATSAGLIGPFAKSSIQAAKVALSNVPTFAELNVKMKAALLETGVAGDHLCWVMTKSMAATLEGQPINSSGIYVPMIQNGMLCGIPVYTTNAIRKAVVSYQKYTAGQTNAWAAYTLQSSDTITYKVSGDTTAHALAKITSPEGGKIAEVTVLTEYIGLGDWRYQPMGLFNSIRFIVDPYSKARNDAVDFVLNCDYATKTLRDEAFLIGEVAASS